MALSNGVLVSLCNLYRPYNSALPIAMNVSCRLTPVFGRNRAGAPLTYSHILEVQPSTDIRDGCTRQGGAANLVYVDGDRVQMTINSTLYTFVVVWVELVNPDTTRDFKRAYLLRN